MYRYTIRSIQPSAVFTVCLSKSVKADSKRQFYFPHWISALNSNHCGGSWQQARKLHSWPGSWSSGFISHSCLLVQRGSGLLSIETVHHLQNISDTTCHLCFSSIWTVTDIFTQSATQSDFLCCLLLALCMVLDWNHLIQCIAMVMQQHCGSRWVNLLLCSTGILLCSVTIIMTIPQMQNIMHTCIARYWKTDHLLPLQHLWCALPLVKLDVQYYCTAVTIHTTAIYWLEIKLESNSLYA